MHCFELDLLPSNLVNYFYFIQFQSQTILVVYIDYSFTKDDEQQNSTSAKKLETCNRLLIVR